MPSTKSVRILRWNVVLLFNFTLLSTMLKLSKTPIKSFFNSTALWCIVWFIKFSHLIFSWLTSLVYIIVIETIFKAGNSIKIFFIKETIDQIRFSIKEIFSLKHFRSIFYHDFRSLSRIRNARLLIKLRRLRN